MIAPRSSGVDLDLLKSALSADVKAVRERELAEMQRELEWARRGRIAKEGLPVTFARLVRAGLRGLTVENLGRLQAALYFAWHSGETEEFGRDPVFAATLRPIFEFLYGVWWRVEASGIEHIPVEGPVPCAVVGAEEIHPILARADWVGRPYGLPYFPLTPTFPWLGPLGLIPLPTKWSIDFSDPIPMDEYWPEGAEDPILVNRLSQEVRETVQKMIDGRLARRRSVWFG
jgi:hypothetical protein